MLRVDWKEVGANVRESLKLPEAATFSIRFGGSELDFPTSFLNIVLKKKELEEHIRPVKLQYKYFPTPRNNGKGI